MSNQETQNNEKPKNDNIELKLSFNKSKIMKFLPFILVVFIFIIIWALPEYRKQDPWNEAANMLDAAVEAESPEEKKRLVMEGGRQLKALAEEYPYHAKIQMYLGTYYFHIGQWDSAVVHYRKSLEQGSGGVVNQIEYKTLPLLRKALIAKINNIINQQDYQAAFNELKKAMAEFPDEPNFKNQLAVAYQKTGKMNEAVKLYQQIIEKHPDFGPAKNNLAGAYFMRGNYEMKQNMFPEALKSYQTAISLMPNNPEVFNNAGICLMNMNRIEEAAAYFKKALDVKPGHIKAQNNLNVALSKIGRN